VNKEKLNIITNQVYSIDHKYVNNIYWTGNISLSEAIYIFFQSYILLILIQRTMSARMWVCAYNIYIYTFETLMNIKVQTF